MESGVPFPYRTMSTSGLSAGIGGGNQTPRAWRSARSSTSMRRSKLKPLSHVQSAHPGNERLAAQNWSNQASAGSTYGGGHCEAKPNGVRVFQDSLSRSEERRVGKEGRGRR